MNVFNQQRGAFSISSFLHNTKMTASMLMLVASVWAMPASAQKKNKQPQPTPKDVALATINRATAESVVEFLSCDELEGRESGFHGSYVTSQYLASQLKMIGVKPLYDSYFQDFDAYAQERQKQNKRYSVAPDSIAKWKNEVHRKLHMRNVLGMIPGEKSDEYVIVGAHFDHLGTDPALDGDKIYNGADDNASGVSAVLQIARAFVASGQKPLRNVIIALWDGEERGLLGSHYFVDNCKFRDNIHGYLNFDMIGRNNREDNPPYVVYFYTAAHPAFGDWLKNDIATYNLRLDPDYRAWDKPLSGSDNASFAKYEIPIIWYHTDGHPDYHQPTDHADRLNWDKVVEITKASFLNVWNLANEAEY